MTPRIACGRWPALLLLVLLAACGGDVDSLPGAVGQIPIFNPSKYLDYSSAYTSDDFGDPMKFSSYSWELETERPADEVIAFYTAQWPQAGREDDEEENVVRIRNPAFPEDEDAPLGESVMITVWRDKQGGKTKFEIDEDVFRARRP